MATLALGALSAIAGPAAQAASGGPAVSEASGDASSGGNFIVPPSSGLNIGAVVNALAGQKESGGLPLTLPTGLGMGLSKSNQVGAQANLFGSSVGFNLSPIVLGGAAVAAFLILRNR